MSKTFIIKLNYAIIMMKEGNNVPRVDIFLLDLIDDITYAKRTLILQKTFNQIKNRY